MEQKTVQDRCIVLVLIALAILAVIILASQAHAAAPSAVLEWDHPGGADHYKVCMAQVPDVVGSPESCYETPAGQPEHKTITISLDFGKTYWFVAYAVPLEGEISGPSNVVTFTTPALPLEAPTNLRFTLQITFREGGRFNVVGAGRIRSGQKIRHGNNQHEVQRPGRLQKQD